MENTEMTNEKPTNEEILADILSPIEELEDKIAPDSSANYLD